MWFLGVFLGGERFWLFWGGIVWDFFLFFWFFGIGLFDCFVGLDFFLLPHLSNQLLSLTELLHKTTALKKKTQKAKNQH